MKRTKNPDNNKIEKEGFIAKVGQKIPDPVIIFIGLYAVLMVITAIFGGSTFDVATMDGGAVTYEIPNMFATENVRWIFNNALLNNWLGYAGGIMGTILIVMLGIGVCEESGLLSTLIRKMGGRVSARFLPYVLVFLGIMSNLASDAGYIILVPLAGLLYVSIGKHPIVGMAAAFAGVSAGFSANLVPATVIDVIIGTNAEAFAAGQGVPFISYLGHELNPFTMHYFFMVASTVLLVFLGGFITNKFIAPKFESRTYEIPEDLQMGQFEVTAQEKKGLRWAGIGFLLSIAMTVGLAMTALAPYVNEAGKEITPYLDNIILLMTFVFFLSGLFFGFGSGKFQKSGDVVVAMSKQMGSMGYVIVLSFFCYNFLALLTYTNLGTYITLMGAKGLEAIGLAQYPILLLIGFILLTAVINLFVGGLSSKWMLLGPIFIPMLYTANSSMTPDVVAAAFRVADSCTNIITPLMTYAGVILLYMRKYEKKFTVGNLIGTMMPYSIIFTIAWTAFLVGFILLGIPLGF